MLLNFDSFVIAIIIHLAFFFISALVSQRLLYQLRPDASQLTVFYMGISLGGALGGLFAGLIASFLFSSILEYPLLIAATLFSLTSCAKPRLVSLLESL